MAKLAESIIQTDEFFEGKTSRLQPRRRDRCGVHYEMPHGE